MIITKTPVRISFLGGGTDYPVSVGKWGGICLGTTINKHSYISCRYLPPYFDYKTRLMYSVIETVPKNDSIQHKVIKAVIDYLNLNKEGLEISHMSDLPSYSGTGSSSSFLVGLIHALDKLRGRNELCTPYELYRCAVKIEQRILQDTVGYQDSAWAAFGGLNVFRWQDDTPTVEKIYMSSGHLDYLERSLMLFHTGIIRSASAVAGRYVPSLKDKEYEHQELMKLTEQGIVALKKYNYKEFGNLIHRSWEIKQSLHPDVCPPLIKEMFDMGMHLGAYGGKLMGAGGGGCLMFIVEPRIRVVIESALSRYGIVSVPVKLEPYGSRIILGE